MNAANINRKGRSITEVFGLSSTQSDVLAKRCYMIETTSQNIGEMFSGIVRSSSSVEELALIAFTLGARSRLTEGITRSPGSLEEKITGILDEDLREYQ